MKKTLILSFLLGIVTFGYTQPKIKDLSYPSSVNIFDLYEITFQLGAYTNPYDPEVIDVYAEFTHPTAKHIRSTAFIMKVTILSDIEAMRSPISIRATTVGRCDSLQTKWVPGVLHYMPLTRKAG